MSVQYKAAVITLSDKGSIGQRVDTSGPWIKNYLEENGYQVVETMLLPDEPDMLSKELIRLCDDAICDLILTTGGTGLSSRDFSPEATKAVIEREVPGIAEAIRAYSMTITKRAMLGRGVSGIRKNTLIINLPGSKKAVMESLQYILDTLNHGLGILKGTGGECGENP
ncbi:MAG: MogA/MoaB family molybdenum cofactor biosynthesis protein [Clostridiales bacterium]|nr:MogA/MoaB family molybdenum cofactor biosynthesis protein [Clostridiales bacterium]